MFSIAKPSAMVGFRSLSWSSRRTHLSLGTYSSDESDKVDAMVRAIDWAIAHDLDVLTYSAARFSPENRARLDSAVDRALAKGIVITFIHYPHPGNLLPAWLGPRTGDDERDPDVNILQYDYSVVRTKLYADWMQHGGTAAGYQPFLSISSTSPVTAGFVALLRTVRPDLKPAELKRILMETSRVTIFEGKASHRTVDIAAALQSVTKLHKSESRGALFFNVVAVVIRNEMNTIVPNERMKLTDLP